MGKGHGGTRNKENRVTQGKATNELSQFVCPVKTYTRVIQAVCPVKVYTRATQASNQGLYTSYPGCVSCKILNKPQ